MDGKKYYCDKCQDTGYVLIAKEDGMSYAKECKCKELMEARLRLKKSGLAKEFRAKSFDNYNTYNNQVLVSAKRVAIQYADTYDQGVGDASPSLLLCGQVGAGKTHLGTACSMRLIDKGVAVIYMCYREEMTAIKSKIMDEIVYNREINRLKNAEVLFIDDFLKGKITEADVNIIYEIINYRYNNNLPVIISTEKTLEGLLDFDEAIGSRIIEMCRGFIIAFKGKELNYRIYRGGAA